MKNKRNGTKNAAKVNETCGTSKKNGQKINITVAKGIFFAGAWLVTRRQNGRIHAKNAARARQNRAPAGPGAGDRREPRPNGPDGPGERAFRQPRRAESPSRLVESPCAGTAQGPNGALPRAGAGARGRAAKARRKTLYTFVNQLLM